MVQILPQENSALYDAFSAVAQGFTSGAQDYIKETRQGTKNYNFGKALGLPDEDAEKLRKLPSAQSDFVGQVLASQHKAQQFQNEYQRLQQQRQQQYQQPQQVPQQLPQQQQQMSNAPVFGRPIQGMNSVIPSNMPVGSQVPYNYPMQQMQTAPQNQLASMAPSYQLPQDYTGQSQVPVQAGGNNQYNMLQDMLQAGMSQGYSMEDMKPLVTEFAKVKTGAIDDRTAAGVRLRPSGYRVGNQEVPFEQVNQQMLSQMSKPEQDRYVNEEKIRDEQFGFRPEIREKFKKIEENADGATQMLSSLDIAHHNSKGAQQPQIIQTLANFMGKEENSILTRLFTKFTSSAWTQAKDAAFLPMLAGGKEYFGNRILLKEFETYIKKLPVPTNYESANELIFENLRVVPRLKIIEREVADEVGQWAEEKGLQRDSNLVKRRFNTVFKERGDSFLKQTKSRMDAIASGTVVGKKKDEILVSHNGAKFITTNKQLEEAKKLHPEANFEIIED